MSLAALLIPGIAFLPWLHHLHLLHLLFVWQLPQLRRDGQHPSRHRPLGGCGHAATRPFSCTSTPRRTTLPRMLTNRLRSKASVSSSSAPRAYKPSCATRRASPVRCGG
ncbi:hypothetical protein EI94DRAFT_87113 [Lactarius quietus]|nr:hypothetical protein EI94DRAFT_87113 [Lactarius quietus]